MKKLTRKQWMSLIDEWMGTQRYITQDWKTTLAKEGGYGATKISSVEQALLPAAASSWPGIWFQSGQSDYTVYARHDYVYSLLFGRLISAGSIKIIAEHIKTLRWSAYSKPTIFDWGGSIFTAHDLYCYLEGKIDQVCIVNLDTPQFDFAKWAIERFSETSPEEYGYVGLSVLSEDRALPFLNDQYSNTGFDELGSHPVVVMSELLEHVQEPEILVSNLVTAGVTKHFYLASSFCTPAYGHHIPITIGGAQYSTPKTANAAFRQAMARIGIKMEKLQGWNSRVYYGHVI